MRSSALVRVAAAVVAVMALGGACGSDTAKSGGTTQLSVTHELDRSCVPIGERQTLLATTEPNVHIAFVPQYEDRLNHGETPKGFTNDKGIFKRSWTIPSDAPPGMADVRIIAAKGRKTANIVLTFNVVPEGEPCT